MDVSVNGEQLYTVGQQLAQTEGKTINDKMVYIYNSINELGQGEKPQWGGSRFNALVQVCNDMHDELLNMVTIVSKQIPEGVMQSACNYINADVQNSSKQIEPVTITAIPDITPSANPSSLDFQETPVTETKTNVFSAFDDVLKALDEMASKITNTESIWSSGAATEYRNRVKTIRDSMNTSIDKIKTQFNASVEQSIADFKAAENASNVKNG